MAQSEDEPHESKTPLQRADRWRANQAVCNVGPTLTENKSGLLVGVAKRADARQQQRLATCFEEKGLTQCARRAPRRQIKCV